MIEDAQPDTQELVAGLQIGNRYRVLLPLGSGGTARVFKAHDDVIERDVAIKVLHLKFAHMGEDTQAKILERFKREAKLAAKIKHPSVVNIFDIGQLDNKSEQPFIVMEFLEGHDLEHQLVKLGAMKPARLLPLFIDCLDALGKAHDQGIVHKDLKPSNLFLTGIGERSEAIRLVDFGIAHIKNMHHTSSTSSGDSSTGGHRHERLTRKGEFIGTLQYMAPEYIESQMVLPAFDVYQMAMILIELLSGDGLIKVKNPLQALEIHQKGLLEIPLYLLESPLGPVLLKALARDYKERYDNGHDFANALSAIDPKAVPLSPLLDAKPGFARKKLCDLSQELGLDTIPDGQSKTKGLLSENKTYDKTSLLPVSGTELKPKLKTSKKREHERTLVPPPFDPEFQPKRLNTFDIRQLAVIFVVFALVLMAAFALWTMDKP